MSQVAKHHRIVDFRNAYGKDQDWLFIDCAFIESGIRYAQKTDCKRIAFGSMTDNNIADKVQLDVLNRTPNLEGLRWHPPIPKTADMSALKLHPKLKYLSIVQPKLALDLTAFPQLEFLQFRFSENVIGYNTSKGLRSIAISGLTGDFGFLRGVKNLAELQVSRSTIKSLAGIDKLANLQELELCRAENLSISPTQRS
jgi:hypothetical protein